jgi:hypothetical protein
MTGFQTLLSRLGAATALLAFASGLFGGSTDMAVVWGSLLLLLAGVRHFTGILPHVGIDLGAGLVGMAVLFLVLDSGMGADFWWLLVASWLFSWLAVERGMMSLTNSPVLSNTLFAGRASVFWDVDHLCLADAGCRAGYSHGAFAIACPDCRCVSWHPQLCSGRISSRPS